MKRFSFIRVKLLMLLLCCSVCTGCFWGNHVARENEEMLVTNSVVMTDETEQYQISFQYVTYQDADRLGGMWYDIQNDENTLTFIFGSEAGTIGIIRENSQVAFWDWTYDESDRTFTVNNFSSNYSGADLDELFWGKEFVFRAQT